MDLPMLTGEDWAIEKGGLNRARCIQDARKKFSDCPIFYPRIERAILRLTSAKTWYHTWLVSTAGYRSLLETAAPLLWEKWRGQERKKTLSDWRRARDGIQETIPAEGMPVLSTGQKATLDQIVMRLARMTDGTELEEDDRALAEIVFALPTRALAPLVAPVLTLPLSGTAAELAARPAPPQKTAVPEKEEPTRFQLLEIDPVPAVKTVYPLRIECIGDDEPRGEDKIQAIIKGRLRRSAPPRWVDEIVDLQSANRKRLRPQKDYSRANGLGSRGVMALYLLAPGRLYEVCSPESWKRVDRYHCRVEEGKLRRFADEKEVRAWWEGHRA